MTTDLRLLRLLPAALLCVASFGVALTTAEPGSAGLRAVVFPPWWSEQQVFAAAAAAGRVVAFGNLRFVVVLAPDSRGLPVSGAWLQFPARRAEACGLISAS